MCQVVFPPSCCAYSAFSAIVSPCICSDSAQPRCAYRDWGWTYALLCLSQLGLTTTPQVCLLTLTCLSQPVIFLINASVWTRFFGGAKTRSQTVSGCGTVANLPRDNLPAVRVKLSPGPDCGNSESRLATAPAEQPNAIPTLSTNWISTPSFVRSGWVARSSLQFDGFWSRYRNPGWCRSATREYSNR